MKDGFIKKFFTFTILMFISIIGVKAAPTDIPMQGSITITGSNTPNSTLQISLTSGIAGAYLKNIQWYYNTSNSTSGGSAIDGANGLSFTLTDSYSGKYIYAIATLTTTATGYEDSTVSDITDATTNGTATVASQTNPLVPVNGTVTITGTNTAYSELHATLTDAMSHAYLKNIQWYYSNINSVTNGTAITGATSLSYTVEHAYVGKYIYVVATLSSTASGYEDVIVSDITDAATNGTATVTGDDNPGGDPGNNPGNNPGGNPSQNETFIITYDANGGADAPDASEATEVGTCVSISSVKPTREGYNFLGWSKNRLATFIDERYSEGECYDGKYGSVTLYAIWEKTGSNTFVIKYDANGGKDAPATSSKTNIGTCATISSVKPTRKGYIFLGWSKNKKATKADTNYAGGKCYKGTDGDLTLYAVWKKEDVVNPKTGIMTYFIAYFAVAATGILSLYWVRRKGLFKQI